MSGERRHFLLPDLGEGLTEAEIVRWLVAVGDEVAVDQPVVEVETAKAAVEVPTPFGGVVAELHGAEGAMLAVGTPLISITESARAHPRPAEIAVPAARGPAGSPAAHGFAEPGVVTATDSTAPADAAGSGNVLVGYGTAQTRRSRRRRLGFPDPDRPAPAEQIPRAPHPADHGENPVPAGDPATAAGRGRVPVSSPVVRRLARENGIDPQTLRGSGAGGLVVRRDVVSAIDALATAEPAAPDGGPEGAATRQRGTNSSTVDHLRPGRRIPLRGVRRAVAEQMSRSRKEIPEATVWVDVDAGGLLALRRDINAADPQRPVSLLGLLGRFCALGLDRFPELNSTVDTERGEIVLHPAVHLGFAAQTERGLVVPVVRDAGAASARELTARLGALTEAARGGGLPPADLTGGTFTVNNYGVFGVDGSAAIINYPEAAILGIGRIIDRPWVVDGQLAVRPVTELTLAFDHRVCDGRIAGGFLRFVADCVERPATLLADL